LTAAIRFVCLHHHCRSPPQNPLTCDAARGCHDSDLIQFDTMSSALLLLLLLLLLSMLLLLLPVVLVLLPVMLRAGCFSPLMLVIVPS